MKEKLKNTLFVQATELFWKTEESKAEKEDGNDDKSETTEKDQIEQTEEKENVSTMSLLAIQYPILTRCCQHGMVPARSFSVTISPRY